MEITKKEIDWLVDNICALTGLSPYSFNDSRSAESVFIRNVIYLFLREKLKLSSTYVGKLLNRDHSTMICGYKRMLTEMNTYNGYVLVRARYSEKKIKKINIRELLSDLNKLYDSSYGYDDKFEINVDWIDVKNEKPKDNVFLVFEDLLGRIHAGVYKFGTWISSTDGKIDNVKAFAYIDKL